MEDKFGRLDSGYRRVERDREFGEGKMNGQSGVETCPYIREGTGSSNCLLMVPQRLSCTFGMMIALPFWNDDCVVLLVVRIGIGNCKIKSVRLKRIVTHGRDTPGARGMTQGGIGS